MHVNTGRETRLCMHETSRVSSLVLMATLAAAAPSVSRAESGCAHTTPRHSEKKFAGTSLAAEAEARARGVERLLLLLVHRDLRIPDGDEGRSNNVHVVVMGGWPDYSWVVAALEKADAGATGVRSGRGRRCPNLNESASE